jgi:outer membrane protein, heavy metal efflux system
LAKNPQLLEAKQQINIFKEIPDQAGSLDDPILQFGLMNMPLDTFSFSQEPMTQKQVTLSQKFPFPGKLGLKTEIAQKNVVMVEKNYDELQRILIKEVKQSYYELCFVLAAIEITKQNKKLLKQFVTIAQTKYSVGKGIQQDVIKAQVELSKTLDELIRLNQLKETEKSKLNTFMNRLPQAPLIIPHGIQQTAFKYSIVDLQFMLERHRPTLKQITAMIERFQASRQLAKKQYYPDFNIGLRYGQREDSTIRDNPDFVSAYVGVNIPLWFETKQKKKVAEEGYRVSKAKQTYNKLKNQFYLDIKKVLDEEKKGSQVINLIKKGIIPQARQSLESALAGYGVDKVDFLTLLDSQVTLFKWQIKYHRELTNYEKNLAGLENVIGRDLF